MKNGEKTALLSISLQLMKQQCMQKTINSDLPVEIVEEREQIKAQLTPGLLLAVVKNVGIHHTDRIVHDFRTVGRPMEKPGKEEPRLTFNPDSTDAYQTSVVKLYLHRW